MTSLNLQNSLQQVGSVIIPISKVKQEGRLEVGCHAWASKGHSSDLTPCSQLLNMWNKISVAPVFSFVLPCPPCLIGTLLAVQFVHALVNRIIPTANGFIAPTRHGYLIRERFQCPSSRASQQDPLKNFKKAVWMIKSRQREELAAAAAALQDSGSGSAQGNECKSNKRSQVCLIV